MSEATPQSRDAMIAAHPQWWFGAMLLALHAALVLGIETLFSRAMLLAHFGFFLIWQPVWRGERKLDARNAFLIIIVGDRKSTRLNSSHVSESRMPSSA